MMMEVFFTQRPYPLRFGDILDELLQVLRKHLVRVCLLHLLPFHRVGVFRCSSGIVGRPNESYFLSPRMYSPLSSPVVSLSWKAKEDLTHRWPSPFRPPPSSLLLLFFYIHSLSSTLLERETPSLFSPLYPRGSSLLEKKPRPLLYRISL